MQKHVRNRNGSAIVEASLVVPIIIIVAVCLVRLFAFYLEILTTSVSVHEEAIYNSISSRSNVISIFRSTEEVSLVPLNSMSKLKKTIRTRAYVINEDQIIRIGDLINEE